HVEDDGIVAVVECLHPDHRLGFASALRTARVIPGPFAEWTLVAALLTRGRNFALDGDLRLGRDGQACQRTANDLQRPAPHAPGHIQLRHAPGQLGMRRQEGQRITAEGDDHRTAPAAIPVALADLPPVLARAGPQAQHVPFMDLHAVCANVQEAALGIAVDHAVAGTDVASTVTRMKTRHRQPQDVDLLAGKAVLHHGTRGHFCRRQRMLLSLADAPRHEPRQLELGTVDWQTKGQSTAAMSRDGQAGNAIAGRIAGDPIEQDQRRIREKLGRSLRQRADLLVPVCAFDVTHLSDRAAGGNELSQVAGDGLAPDGFHRCLATGWDLLLGVHAGSIMPSPPCRTISGLDNFATKDAVLALIKHAQPVVTRSKLVLEVASELVTRADKPWRQAMLYLRDQGAGDWSARLFASDTPSGIEAVAKGEADLAIINPSAPLTVAYRGNPPYKEPQPLRIITVIPSYDQFMFAVKVDTELSCLEEVGEKRVPLKLSLRGQPDHSIHFVLDHVLQAVGFSLDDLRSWGGEVHYHAGMPNADKRIGGVRRGEMNALCDE